MYSISLQVTTGVKKHLKKKTKTCIVHCLTDTTARTKYSNTTISIFRTFPPESQLKQSGTLSNTILWNRFTVFLVFVSPTLLFFSFCHERNSSQAAKLESKQNPRLLS